MNYDLAKELKDAGYKMALANENDIMSSRSDVWRDPVSSGHWYLFPTLEELIEACGDELYSVINRANGMGNGWEVRGENDRFTAPTLIEAVTLLWLFINKKV